MIMVGRGVGVSDYSAHLPIEHGYEVVRAHGETGPQARLVPLTVDGLIYASSMVLLHSARRDLPAPSLARWLLGVGIAATLAANIAHGWAHGPIGAAVATWPAIALVGSYELLMWLIRTQAAAPANQQDQREQDRPGPVGTEPEPVIHLAPGTMPGPDLHRTRRRCRRTRRASNPGIHYRNANSPNNSGNRADGPGRSSCTYERIRRSPTPKGVKNCVPKTPEGGCVILSFVLGIRAWSNTQADSRWCRSR